jgi:hypothetical protein
VGQRDAAEAKAESAEHLSTRHACRWERAGTEGWSHIVCRWTVYRSTVYRLPKTCPP